jgi:hypothetical protein
MPQIPVTNALGEADPSSVQELFSRNPEQYSQGDIDYLINYFRDLRVKMASASVVRHTRAKISIQQQFAENEDKILFDDL